MRATSTTAEINRAARAATLNSLGISPREHRAYSLSKAILAIGTDERLTGYEAEVDQQVRRAAKVESNTGHSVFIPTGLAFRDLTATTGNAGGYVVGTDNRGDAFIDLLRNRLVVTQLGARMMSGLVGNVTIPKQTAAATAQWLTNESTQITESQMTLGQLALTPKTVGGYTEVSRQLMLQSNPAIEALVFADLAKTLATAIDLAAIAGTGSGGQPTGIINTAGIGSVTGTSIDYAKVLEFQTDVASAGGPMTPDALAYVTTPAVAAMLKQRVMVAATNSPLWEGSLHDGKVAGVRAMSSQQVPDATMIAGAWDELIVAEWGYLELMSNPYANFQAGIIGLRAMQSVDIGVRRPACFSVASSIT